MLVIRLLSVPSGWGSGGDSTGTRECSVSGDGGGKGRELAVYPPAPSVIT